MKREITLRDQLNVYERLTDVSRHEYEKQMSTEQFEFFGISHT